MGFRKFLSKLLSLSQTFRKSSKLEVEVREKLEGLLPPNFKVEKASKYTESPYEYSGDERLSIIPPDYFITYKNEKIAVIEVTSGVAGYTIHNSRFLKITNKKVKALEKEKIPAFLIVVVIGEPNKDSLERYIWCTPEKILKYELVHEQVPPYDEWEYNHHVPIKEWSIGLDSLVKDIVKNAREKQQTF